jgi:MoaA/NifB/PqqE/SkfB family radical SAM enzyme
LDFLTLFISLRCTQSCEHCLYGCSPESGEDMSRDVFSRSMEIAKNHNISKLNFFGGEPLINPEFFPMLQASINGGFSLILSTNCRPLVQKRYFSKFLDITKECRERIIIVTARDHFHLKFFDPSDIINELRSNKYEVVINDYCDNTVLLSEYNATKQELLKLDTRFSCCGAHWTDNLGVLPNGGWSICPPSLEAFGNVFSDKLEDILEFKMGLSFNYKAGCSECLKDFKEFGIRFKQKPSSGE